VTVLVGSLLNPRDVERAVQGCEAVICAIGPRMSAPDIFCAGATRNILEAMKAQGVRRLLCITGAMVGDYPHLSWFMRGIMSSYRKNQPAQAQDRTEQEKLVEESGLDWTLVKPPRLSNGAARGRIRAGTNLKVGAFSSISRMDLSIFILDQVEAKEYMGEKVIVQY
jgi:putative NADH-flavin reductase